MKLTRCLFFALIGFTIALPGEFIPKSFYTIDEDGHKSYVFKLNPPRYRRDAYSAAGAGYGGGAGFGDPSNIAQFLDAGFQDTFNQFKSLAAQAAANGNGGFVNGGGGFANGGGGFPNGGNARSYSGSFSSGGPGAQGQVLHSRFADDENGFEREFVTRGGGGIQSVASSSGSNGAVSFSSSSTDDNGNVHYRTYAKKF